MSTRAARPGRAAHGHGASWDAARLAASDVAALPPSVVPLAVALGLVLADDLRAVNDLPAADSSAMDGWAVAGTPPWRPVPAGSRDHPGHLVPGTCVRIATGAAVPVGTSRVLPVEESTSTVAGVAPTWWATDGPTRTHVRTRGEEARSGDVLLAAGSLVTPPVIGLAAAAGNDVLAVVPAPTVQVLVLGDELTSSGPADGVRVRDALGPQLPGWLTGPGLRAPAVRHLPDDLAELTGALVVADAHVVVTTGGTGPGRGDHVRAALARAGGRLVVDGVDVKPGRHMLLAELPGGRRLVALPGNPFAACAALVTLVLPLLAALSGRPVPPDSWTRLLEAAPPRPGDGHRLLPVRLRAGAAEPLPSCGPAMLRGLALADGLAVVPPAGAVAGDAVRYLSLPWTAAAATVDPPTRDLQP